MSYDNNVGVQIVQKDPSAGQEESLNEYRNQVADLSNQIKDANDELVSINEQIKDREKDLADVYDRETAKIEAAKDAFQAEQISLTHTIESLDAEIEAKQHQRDTALDSITEREVNSLKKQTDLDSQAAVIAQANTLLDEREAKLNVSEVEFTKDREAFDDYRNQQLASIEESQQKLNYREDQLKVKEADVLDKTNQVLIKESELADRELALSEKSIIAQGVIDQAGDVTSQLKEIQQKLDEINTKTQLNISDAAQIQTAKLALANKEAELHRREITVQQAEQRSIQ